MLAKSAAFMSLPASISKKVTTILTKEQGSLKYEQKRKPELVVQMKLGYGGKPASSQEEDLALTVEIIKKHSEIESPKASRTETPLATKQEEQEPVLKKRTKAKHLAKGFGKNLKEKATSVTKNVKTNVSSFVAGA